MDKLTGFAVHNNRCFDNRRAKSSTDTLVTQTDTEYWVSLVELSDNLAVSAEIFRIGRIAWPRRYDDMTEFSGSYAVHRHLIISNNNHLLCQLTKILICLLY